MARSDVVDSFTSPEFTGDAPSGPGPSHALLLLSWRVFLVRVLSLEFLPLMAQCANVPASSSMAAGRVPARSGAIGWLRSWARSSEVTSKAVNQRPRPEPGSIFNEG
jgi:hypothetical protein